MESDGELVFNHALLQFFLEFCCESLCPWLRFERRHVNRIAMLRGLANVARASKFSLLNADFSLQFAALRLASADVCAVDVSTVAKEELLLKAFDCNMAVFTKSWRLEVLVPEKFRMLTLRELGVADLQQL